MRKKRGEEILKKKKQKGENENMQIRFTLKDPKIALLVQNSEQFY